MSRYPLVALGEVLTPVRDEVPVELDRTYRTAGIYSFGRGLFARPPIAGADTKYTTLFRLHEGQFVLSRLNGWEGAVALVPPEFDGFVVSQEYPTFDIDRGRADPAYLGWLCRWDRFWEALVPRGSMVRRKRAHPDRLLAVQIPLPPLPEQRRVVSRIKLIAGSIEAARTLQITVGEGCNRLTDSVLRRCSDTAPLVALGEVLTPVRDEVPVELDRTYRTAGIYSFGRGLFARPPIAGADTKYTTLFRLHEGQFVLSRLKRWEGAVAVVPPEFDGFVVSQEYPTFDITRGRADPAYLGWLCRWDRFWESLRSQSKGVGARRDRVHPDRLLAVQIPLPPLPEQRRLGALGQQVNELGERAGNSAAILRALVPSVANAALRGSL